MPKQLPQVYYGLHMNEGVAQYDNDMLFVNNETIKKMNPSFAGRPVYVGHKEVNLENIQNEADGYVVESFYNKVDGKSWVKFIVVSDAGHEAISKGWKLSNSYTVKNSGAGGKWHNVEYNSEVTDGEYSHLAIVENPRYAESIVLTPEQFKDYNLKKENDLKTLENSIKEKKPMSIIEKLKALIQNEEVKPEEKKEEPKNETKEEVKEEVKEEPKNEEPKKEEDEDDKIVNVGEEKVSLKDLKNCWMASKKNEVKEEPKKEEKDESKLNEIKNAIDIVTNEIIDLPMNKIARGQRLYGSK